MPQQPEQSAAAPRHPQTATTKGHKAAALRRLHTPLSKRRARCSNGGIGWSCEGAEVVWWDRSRRVHAILNYHVPAPVSVAAADMRGWQHPPHGGRNRDRVGPEGRMGVPNHRQRAPARDSCALGPPRGGQVLAVVSPGGCTSSGEGLSNARQPMILGRQRLLERVPLGTCGIAQHISFMLVAMSNP